MASIGEPDPIAVLALARPAQIREQVARGRFSSLRGDIKRATEGYEAQDRLLDAVTALETLTDSKGSKSLEGRVRELQNNPKFQESKTLTAQVAKHKDIASKLLENKEGGSALAAEEHLKFAEDLAGVSRELYEEASQELRQAKFALAQVPDKVEQLIQDVNRFAIQISAEVISDPDRCKDLEGMTNYLLYADFLKIQAPSVIRGALPGLDAGGEEKLIAMAKGFSERVAHQLAGNLPETYGDLSHPETMGPITSFVKSQMEDRMSPARIDAIIMAYDPESEEISPELEAAVQSLSPAEIATKPYRDKAELIIAKLAKK